MIFAAFGYILTMSCLSNWGTENNPDFAYHNGNSEPRGFGKDAI